MQNSRSLARPAIAVALAVGLAACASAGAPAEGAGPGGSAGPMMAPPPSAVPVYLNPPSVVQLRNFSSGVKVGLTIYVAGQVSMDSAGNVVGEGDVRAQVKQALANVVAVVRAGRGVPGDIVKLTVYHTTPNDSAVVDGLRTAAGEWFDSGEFPAVTLMAVQHLPVPGLLVAIDGVAQLRGMLPDRTRERPGR
jgi:enamine deaminase RidA (YjgF/YER057c/UK114 family)